MGAGGRGEGKKGGQCAHGKLLKAHVHISTNGVPPKNAKASSAEPARGVAFAKKLAAMQLAAAAEGMEEE